MLQSACARNTLPTRLLCLVFCTEARYPPWRSKVSIDSKALQGSVMATVISPTDRRVIIKGVSWETYERLLADFGDSHAARLTFDQGMLARIIHPSSSNS
jgi:hypothetical protein